MGYSEEIRTIGQIRARHGGISTESQKSIGSVDTRGKEKTEFATDRELTDAQRGIAFGKEFINEERNDIRGIQETGRQLSSIDGEWNNGTNARGSVRQRRGYSDGDYSIEQPEYRTEPKKEEIIKATTVKNSDKISQVVAKKSSQMVWWYTKR